MLAMLLIHEELACGEEAAPVSGALINPNTSRLEYLLLRGPDGAELVAPLNLLEQTSGALRVILAPARLPAMPDPATATAPPAQGTLPSNLDGLCLARADTPVMGEPETLLGPLRGLGLDADFHIRQVLTAAHPDPIPVERIARYSTDALTVILEKG
ncbi:MAG TPA: hypothetical protein VFS21_32565 [Roseiflexaceae bacterium]|nr:hypothetical protein [Roseiflexaceae bacterium]